MESLEMIRAMVDKVADQLSACAAAAAPLDARARDTLHAGLAHAALGTHMAAEAKAELEPLLAAAEELQAAVKPTGSWLGAVVGGIFGRLVGVKRARE
jgi:ABC-type transporter Mla subunit MlaD